MLIIAFIFVITASLYFCALVPETSRKAQMSAYHGTMFAHRGCHSSERGIPENSIPAFRAAVEKNYGIELDIHFTQDTQLVFFHDDTLTRMCHLDKTPEEMTLQELKGCSLSGTREHIPTLEEVLALVNGQVPLLIELKLPGRSTALCKRAYRALKSYHGLYLVQSFNTLGLHWFYVNAPHVLRGQLASNLTKSDDKPHWLFRFLAKHLMLNFWGRPDFISYKLADLPTLNTSLLRRIFGTPFAVWTLKNSEALKEGIRHYDMQIFEITAMNGSLE